MPNDTLRRLKLQLIARVTALFVIASLIQLGLDSYRTRALHEAELRTFLTLECDRIVRGISLDDRYTATVKPDLQAGHYGAGGSDYFALVIGQAQLGQQKFKSPSLGKGTLPTPPLEEGATQAYPLSDNPAVFVLSKGYVLRGMPLTVSVGRPIGEVQQRMQTEIGISLAVLVTLALLLAWVLYRTLSRVTGPLKTLQGDLEESVLGSRTIQHPDQVNLADIQRLVDLSIQRVDRSRSAISNLSHLLKTPLSAIIGLANSDELLALPGIRQEILLHAKSIKDNIDYRLKNAQLSGVATPDTVFNPAQEIDGMIMALTAIYRDKGVVFHKDIHDRSYLVDRQDAVELLGNLLDNACKWAESNVALSIGYADGVLSIAVEDDGPGCSETNLRILSEPGMLLNERNTGHGLGMSLVKSIVAMYDGQIQFGRSARWGGFSVLIHIRCRSLEPRP